MGKSTTAQCVTFRLSIIIQRLQLCHQLYRNSSICLIIYISSSLFLDHLCWLYLLRASGTDAVLALDGIALLNVVVKRRILGLASENLAVSPDEEQRQDHHDGKTTEEGRAWTETEPCEEGVAEQSEVGESVSANMLKITRTSHLREYRSQGRAHQGVGRQNRTRHAVVAAGKIHDDRLEEEEDSEEDE